ncbi:MAG: hypothetical protein J6Y64_02185 [Ruminococcus sp.]|nr:hypothetical protein [Ruminococcus sp.]
MSELYELLKAKKMGAGSGGSGDSYTKAEADAKFVPKDADNKYFIVNNIHVYVSHTAPTGDIEDGSLGFGW